MIEVKSEKPQAIYTELLSELIGYIETGKHSQILKHPIIYCDPYFPEMNFAINKQYESKKDLIEKAKISNNYISYVFSHERYYRLKAFRDICEWMSDFDYYKLLSSIWIDAKDFNSQKDLWRSTLAERWVTRKHFMSEEEKIVFGKFSNKFKVYRGYEASVNQNNKFGLSYTLDRKQAETFAKKFGRKGRVWSREVNKEDVFAYINRKEEKEIIILPKK